MRVIPSTFLPVSHLFPLYVSDRSLSRTRLLPAPFPSFVSLPLLPLTDDDDTSHLVATPRSRKTKKCPAVVVVVVVVELEM